MTKKQNEQLRQVIIKAVPEIMKFNRPIRLSDVLLAVENDISTGNLGERFKEICCNWDLTKDLNDQSDETKQFLWDLLCK